MAPTHMGAILIQTTTGTIRKKFEVLCISCSLTCWRRPSWLFFHPLSVFLPSQACLSCLLPALVGKLRIYKAIIPVPFTLVRFNSFVVSCWEVLIVPPFHIPFSALKSHFSEFCTLKCVVSSPTIVPQEQWKKEERWHRETSASRWGNTASWLELRKLLRISGWLGLVKTNLEMRTNRREWCDFLLSGLLSCRYLWRSSGEWRVSPNLLPSSSLSLQCMVQVEK